MNANEFEIVYRFEGESDPGVVLGIKSTTGIKGILVNGYGYSSEPVSDEIERKLRMHAHYNFRVSKSDSKSP